MNDDVPGTTSNHTQLIAETNWGHINQSAPHLRASVKVTNTQCQTQTPPTYTHTHTQVNCQYAQKQTLTIGIPEGCVALGAINQASLLRTWRTYKFTDELKVTV